MTNIIYSKKLKGLQANRQTLKNLAFEFVKVQGNTKGLKIFLQKEDITYQIKDYRLIVKLYNFTRPEKLFCKKDNEKYFKTDIQTRFNNSRMIRKGR